MESYRVLDASDRVVEQPLGVRPVGTLIYFRDGFMSVQMMSTTSDSSLSYFGTYSVDLARAQIVHHVAASSNGFKGTNQVRSYELRDGKLCLKAKRVDGTVATLLWTRAGSQDYH